ncbi:protein of unknown function [Bradyrhizobium vignae]|uniref:Uncharacterized protein n=1 Tax=Bradyrhizobium vignae TaxID=1549949 RepID=A0A2U3PS16_9BRAD|nr:protein of unknown function [Bradyrhizobium vignae]
MHEKILLEPATPSATKFGAIAVTVINGPFVRPRLNDVILMNAGLAKLIPQDLVYSRTAPNVAHVSSEQAHRKKCE